MLVTTQRVRRIRDRSVSATVTRLGIVNRADTSKQINVENEFTNSGFAHQGIWLIPPYDPINLHLIKERSNTIPQCIDAYVTNIAHSGFEIEAIREGMDIDEVEKEELASFIEAVNPEQSFPVLHAYGVNDYETYGYTFVEIIRDRSDRVSLLRNVPAFTMRLSPKDIENPQLITYEIYRGKRKSVIKEYKVFRKFIQLIRGQIRYFKEFGDPRTLNMVTGQYGPVNEDEKATEILHIRQYSPDPYGIPRWINQLPSILGSREAEECNLRYFEDNTVPPAILSIAGGRLTKRSYQELSTALNAQGIGKDRQNKIMLLEATAERESLDDKGTAVNIKLDKLTDARQSDGLFKAYDDGNQIKIRSSFRLPPISIGMAESATYATARVSAFIAESQIFLPLRNTFDEIYNKSIINSDYGLGLKTCKLKSRVPLIVDPETIIKSLTAINVMGGITPRVISDSANQLLQIDLPPYPEKDTDGYEEWMDKPLPLSLQGATPDTPSTHLEQNQKDPLIKDIEATGDISQRLPEHGQE